MSTTRKSLVHGRSIISLKQCSQILFKRYSPKMARINHTYESHPLHLAVESVRSVEFSHELVFSQIVCILQSPRTVPPSFPNPDSAVLFTLFQSIIFVLSGLKLKNRESSRLSIFSLSHLARAHRDSARLYWLKHPSMTYTNPLSAGMRGSQRALMSGLPVCFGSLRRLVVNGLGAGGKSSHFHCRYVGARFSCC